MTDFLFGLGQIAWLVALIYGALLYLKNGAFDTEISRAPGRYKPYLFDSLSGLARQPGTL